VVAASATLITRGEPALWWLCAVSSARGNPVVWWLCAVSCARGDLVRGGYAQSRWHWQRLPQACLPGESWLSGGYAQSRDDGYAFDSPTAPRDVELSNAGRSWPLCAGRPMPDPSPV